MASIHSEYHGFLTYLEQREVHDDVRRFAHLILDHLHTLAEFGSTRRARSKRLVPLVVDNLAQAPIAYAGGVDGPDATPSLERLHQLEVGPFRGFMQRETFDLSHDITLVYGANGTGKSSFFEAIEMAMLGLISEAQAKRVDQREYCNNARLRRHVAPVLSARGANGAEVVRPDESEYRFCFVEKTGSMTLPVSQQGLQAISDNSSQPCSAWISSANSCVVLINRSTKILCLSGVKRRN